MSFLTCIKKHMSGCKNIWVRAGNCVCSTGPLFSRNGCYPYSQLRIWADTSEICQISKEYSVNTNSTLSDYFRLNKQSELWVVSSNTFASQCYIQEAMLKSNSTVCWHTKEQQAVFTINRLLSDAALQRDGQRGW